MRVTEEALQAQRERVRSSWYWMRWAGVGLIVLGLCAAIANLQRGGAHGTPLEIGALVLTVLGWALIAVAFFRRNAYQDRRKP